MGRKPDFKITEPLEKAYLVGALATQLGAIAKTPWAFAIRDAEILIHLLERARASLAKDGIDAETQASVDRIVAEVERLVAAGKVTGQ